MKKNISYFLGIFLFFGFIGPNAFSSETLVDIEDEVEINEESNEKLSSFLDSLPETAKEFLVKPEQDYDLIDNLNDATCSCFHFCNPLAWCTWKHIKNDQVAPAVIGGEYKLLKTGHSAVGLPWNSISPPVSLNQSYINSGDIHVLRITEGTLGVGIDSNGRLKLYAPGGHYIRDPQFKWIGKIDFTKAKFPIENAYEMITIKPGRVGVYYRYEGDKAVLDLLSTGVHLLRNPEKFLVEASIQQEMIGVEGKNFTTADGIGFDYDALVTYQLTHPKKAYIKAFSDGADLKETIKKVSLGQLTQIFRSLNYEQPSDALDGFRNDEEEKKVEDEDAVINDNDNFGSGSANDKLSVYEKFYNDIETKFLKRMEKFGSDYGMKFESIQTQKLEFHDKEMKAAIGRAAIEFAKAKEEKTKAEGLRVKAITDNETARLKAEGDKVAKGIEAETRAFEVTRNAKAEADATRAKADAEKYYAEQVKDNEELTKMRLLLDAHVKALNGVNTAVFGNVPTILDPSGIGSLFPNLKTNGDVQPQAQIMNR